MTRPKIQYTGSAGNYTALRGGTDCHVKKPPRGWQAYATFCHGSGSRSGMTVHYGDWTDRYVTRATRELAATAALNWRDEQDRLRIAKEEGR